MIRKCKIIIFILIIVTISYLCYFAISPSSYMRVVLHEVRNGNYDMVFVGQSRGESSINPFIMDEVLGYNSYNLCRAFVQLPDIQYVVKEANVDKQLRVVVLDVDQLYFYHTDIDYFSDSYMYPHITNKDDKIRYFLSLLNKDYRILLARYTIQGIDDFKASKDRISSKLSKEYHEYSIKAAIKKNEHYTYVGKGYMKNIKRNEKPEEGSAWNKEQISEEACLSIRDIADYCDANGIELIAVHAPVPHERFTEDEHYEQRNTFNKLFAEYGVEFFDFNFIKEEYLTWNKEDFVDLEGHLMSNLADDYSKVLGLVLKNYLEGYDVGEYFADYPNMGD